MSININESLVGVWYFPIRMFPGDWLGAVNVEEDGSYKMVYRVRYYRDDKVGIESEDEKQWFEGTMRTEDYETVIDEIREVVQEIAAVSLTDGSDVYELLMADFDNVEAFSEKLLEAEFAHKQAVH